MVCERRFWYVGIGGTYFGCCVIGWVNVFPSYLVVVGNLGVHTSVLMLYVGFRSYKSVLVFDLVWVFKFFFGTYSSVSNNICRLLCVCAGHALPALLSEVTGHELLGGGVVVYTGGSVLSKGVHYLPPVTGA